MDQAGLNSTIDEAAWDRLARLTPQPDPFSATTHWQLSYREALDPHRPLIVRSSADGLVHFTQHFEGKALLPIESNWRFGCNLLGPGAIDLLDVLLGELAADSEEWVVFISGIDPDGTLPQALRVALGSRYRLQPVRSEMQCGASLENGLDGFLSRRSANMRRNLRRSTKRAAENGLTFERFRPASAGEADAVFARMLAVEHRSWKGLGRCGMESPSMSRFYSTMLRRLARSEDGRVILAVRDGEDIGFIFGGMSDGIYRGQQFSFDQDYAALSIGNLMQFEQISWLCEEGASRYDLGPLLGPSMEYKYGWTELDLPIELWLIGRQL